MANENIGRETSTLFSLHFKNNTYIKMLFVDFHPTIQNNHFDETGWQAQHSGLEYHNLQLDIGLSHKQILDSSDVTARLAVTSPPV